MPDYPEVSCIPNTSHHHCYGGRPNQGYNNKQVCHYLQIGGSDNCHERKPTKQLLSEYKRNSKIKSQEYSKFLQDKNSSITILYGQCNEATQTEIALRDNYAEDRNEGRLLVFIDQLRAISYGGNNSCI